MVFCGNIRKESGVAIFEVVEFIVFWWVRGELPGEKLEVADKPPAEVFFSAKFMKAMSGELGFVEFPNSVIRGFQEGLGAMMIFDASEVFPWAE